MSAPNRQSAKAAEIADGLHSAVIHLLRRLRSVDRQSGLSAPRLSAMSVVVFRGPISLGDLAAAEQVQPPTMTRLVRDLERLALVERVADPHDGRVQRIRATPFGRRILEQGRRRRVRELTRQIAALPRPDRELLARAATLLEHLSRADARRPGKR